MRPNQSRPRVLMLATRIPIRVGDGTPSFVLEGASALIDDFDITILAPRVKGAKREDVLEGVLVRRFAYFPKRWERLADDAIMPQLGQSPLLWLQALCLTAAMLVAAYRETRRARVDLVHAQWILPAGLVGIILKGTLRLPAVITARGSDVFTMNSPPILRLKRRLVQRADDVVVTSLSMIAPLDISGAIVQPSGVDVERWGRATSPRNPEHGIVLFVGRLARNKGAHIAIGCLHGLPDVQLRIIGDGPERPRLESLAHSIGVSDRVTFLGRADRVTVENEYRRAACVVIPSLIGADGAQEGTPNVLGEAVASGVPVVASALTGLAELIDHGRTGLLVSPGDEAGLRQALRRLVASEHLREEIALNARLHLAPRLSRRKAMQVHRELYLKHSGFATR